MNKQHECTSRQRSATRKQRPATHRQHTYAPALWLMLGIAVSIGVSIALVLTNSRGETAHSTPLTTHASMPLTPGMLAPDIRLTTALGGQFHLAEQHGHVIVMAFVQTQPDTVPTDSLRQVVSLESMAQQYGAKGVQVVFVEATALVTGSAPAPTALLNTTYDWHLGAIPLAIDGEGVAQQYGVRRVPTTFVIGQDGRVVQRFDGAVLAADMAATLQTLVGPPTH